MPKIECKKENYDCHKKEVSDKSGMYMPRHAGAVILCALEEILDRVKAIEEKCNETRVSNEQAGVVNVNVEEVITKATKKGK